MQDVQLQAGKVVFREGDPADYAYIIQTGQVEILKRAALSNVRVGLIGPGDLFGEMGVIDDRPRSATARAVTDVVATAFDQQAFVDMVLRQPQQSLAVMRTLCERLRTITDQFAALDDDGPAPPPSITKVSFEDTAALDPEAERGFEIDRFPFRVGRKPETEAESALAFNDKAFHDTPPYALSLNHFLLDLTVLGIVCRDRGSRTGTIVNGVPIGGNTGRFSEPLRIGDNEIIAGPRDSGFRFLIQVDAS